MTPPSEYCSITLEVTRLYSHCTHYYSFGLPRYTQAYDTVQLLQGGFRSLRAHTELWDVRHLRHAPNAQDPGARRAAVAILVSREAHK